MSPIGDYGGEMSTLPGIDDPTAEDLLAGRPVGEELAPLAAALSVYRDAVRRPVPPRGELAAWLSTGCPVPTAGRHRQKASLPAPTRLERRTRISMSSGLAALAAKLAGVGLAAKAGAGVAVALASVGTAGVTGLLPEPVQERFDSVVESVINNQPAGPDPVPAGPNSEFGERVSDDARDGGVDGEQVSEQARRRGESRRPGELPSAPAAPGRPENLPTPEHLPTPDGLPTPDDPAAGRSGQPPGRQSNP